MVLHKTQKTLGVGEPLQVLDGPVGKSNCSWWNHVWKPIVLFGTMGVSLQGTFTDPQLKNAAWFHLQPPDVPQLEDEGEQVT